MCFARRVLLVFILLLFTIASNAQVYSPSVLRKGQVDASNLTALAQGIYKDAGAATDRQKAEAIWRFFLTDGRFVKPGFWYHIAGWAYEEPLGEVLDPIKLLNSYGFGLCYQIAPVLEAVYKAGGFKDARVWFLTGHTVTEVFYDGAYHYYDSDMLGYNTVGKGDVKTLPVASVRQIERDGNIILSKLLSPKQADKSLVDDPWYPADVRAGAMGGMAGLFTTTSDNRLYAYTRNPQGHTMDFVLRRGESLTRYFKPEDGTLYYLPYKFLGGKWQEFPQEIGAFGIRTADGPKSQKDTRRWATGRIEYTPVLSDKRAYNPAFSANLRVPESGKAAKGLTRQNAGSVASAVFEMPSPYVIIDAGISMNASLKSEAQSLSVETSVDNGKTWDAAGTLKGPHEGNWQVPAAVKFRSAHGTLTAVSGTYGYLVKLTMTGPGPADAVGVDAVRITTRLQVNPRTLPALEAGRNEMLYRQGPAVERRNVPVSIEQVQAFAQKALNSRYVGENGQGYLMPESGKEAEFVFELTAPDGSPLSGFDAGGRFLEIRDGIAPDKLTAEVRKTSIRSTAGSSSPKASLAWATSPEGPYTTLWRYEEPKWLDGEAIDRTLRWPEVDRSVRSLPQGTRKVYVRYQLQGMALDDFRLAVLSPAPAKGGQLEVTHVWTEGGQERRHVERITVPAAEHSYMIETGAGGAISNEAVILSCR